MLLTANRTTGGLSEHQDPVRRHRHQDLPDSAGYTVRSGPRRGSVTPRGEVGRGGVVDAMPGLQSPVPERDGEMRLAHAGREPDRLQQVLKAASFRRWAGELLLVVTLPDGSPGTVRADDTGVFGDADCVPSAGVVLDAAGLRELRGLVSVIGRSASAAGHAGVVRGGMSAASSGGEGLPPRRGGRAVVGAARQARAHVGSPHS